MTGVGAARLSRLDLNDSQKRQVLTIQEELKLRTRSLMGEMYKEMDKLRKAMWSSEKHDREIVLASNDRMSDLREQMLKNSRDAADKVNAILTPSQREALSCAESGADESVGDEYDLEQGSSAFAGLPGAKPWILREG